MNKIYILSIIAFAILCSCQSKTDQTPAKSKTETTAAKKRPKKANKAATKAKRDYWITLQGDLGLNDEQIKKLKDLKTARTKEIKAVKSMKERALIKRKYEDLNRDYLGQDLTSKKNRFDNNWDNPLSSLNLFYSLDIKGKDRKRINALKKKYQVKWRNLNQSTADENKSSAKQTLINEKMIELKSILSDDQYAKLTKIMKETNKSKIKGVYPF